MSMDYAARQARFEDALREAEIDLFFCPPSADLEYLTGLRRRIPSFGNSEQAHQWATGTFFSPGREPVYVVLKASAAFRVTDGTLGEVIEMQNLDDPRAMFDDAIRRIGGGKRIGLSARTWASTIVELQRALPGVELVNGDDLMNRLRRIKEPEELETMKRACEVADAVMADIAPKVVEGVTELELASEVDYLLRKHGARTWAFDTGAFSMGPNEGRDFGIRVSGRALVPGDAVSFDFGGVVDGYCSDFGRTVHVGEPTEEFVRCHEIVVAAEAAGADAAAAPGATGADVHRATRTVIEEAGYGERYRHRTGHCVGLDTHERPFLSEEDETPLEPGMTFTIEPSIFWPGRVGVRVEDLYVLEEGGCRNLNEFHHEVLATS
jgi:Xaa-Pro aminopeptidase